MSSFENMLILLLVIAGLSVVGRWLPWPMAITYLLGGVAVAYLLADVRWPFGPGLGA